MKKNKIIIVISMLLVMGLFCSCGNGLKFAKPSSNGDLSSEEPQNEDNICGEESFNNDISASLDDTESSCIPLTSSAEDSSSGGSGSTSGDSQGGQGGQGNSGSKKPSSSSKKQSTAATSSKKPTTPPSSNKIWDKGGNYTGSINIKGTNSPKTDVFRKGNVMLDMSNKAAGYATVSVKESSKMKVQVKFGSITYNYDLNNTGKEEVIPLQFGNGTYTFRFMKNLSDDRYTPIATQAFSVSLSNQNNPFLIPNQFVNYSSSSSAIRKSFGLSMNAKNDLEKTRSIYNYIIENIKYDTYKAENVQSGYLPNIDNTFSTKKGICFDYAALMAAMLRAQGIPTKLIIGTVAPNSLSHAWNMVYINGKGWIAVGIDSNGNQWKRLDATFGTAKNQSDIAKFIGNGSNYTQLRYY